MTSWANSISWRFSASVERAMALSTMLDMATMSSRSSCSCCMKCSRVIAASRPPSADLAEPSRDVILGPLILGFREELPGGRGFDENPLSPLVQREKDCLIGDTRRLLHIVRHDHDRVLPRQLAHQV